MSTLNPEASFELPWEVIKHSKRREDRQADASAPAESLTHDNPFSFLEQKERVVTSKKERKPKDVQKKKKAAERFEYLTAVTGASFPEEEEEDLFYECEEVFTPAYISSPRPSCADEVNDSAASPGPASDTTPEWTPTAPSEKEAGRYFPGEFEALVALADKKDGWTTVISKGLSMADAVTRARGVTVQAKKAIQVAPNAFGMLQVEGATKAKKGKSRPRKRKSTGKAAQTIKGKEAIRMAYPPIPMRTRLRLGLTFFVLLG
ncbi:hypothetical protein B0J14DRAFT_580243 [Halenospora varia]|nr:hypothetical protein B0J14DRAFT_580243 [Halenospora varia]